MNELMRSLPYFKPNNFAKRIGNEVRMFCDIKLSTSVFIFTKKIVNTIELRI